MYCKDTNRRGEPRAHQLRLPRLHLPGPPGQGPKRLLRGLLTGHERQGDEGERPADQGLAPQSSQRDGPVRPRRGDQSPGARLDQLLRGLLPLPSWTSSHGASTSTSSGGPCTSSSDCGEGPCGPGPGCNEFVSDSPGSSPTGTSSHSPTVGLWEPGEGRLSRRVLREPGGAIPPGHLSFQSRCRGMAVEDGPRQSDRSDRSSAIPRRWHWPHRGGSLLMVDPSQVVQRVARNPLKMFRPGT